MSSSRLFWSFSWLKRSSDKPSNNVLGEERPMKGEVKKKSKSGAQVSAGGCSLKQNKQSLGGADEASYKLAAQSTTMLIRQARPPEHVIELKGSRRCMDSNQMVGCGRVGGGYQEIQVRAQASGAISFPSPACLQVVLSALFQTISSQTASPAHNADAQALPSNATTSWSRTLFKCDFRCTLKLTSEIPQDRQKGSWSFVLKRIG